MADDELSDDLNLSDLDDAIPLVARRFRGPRRLGEQIVSGFFITINTNAAVESEEEWQRLHTRMQLAARAYLRVLQDPERHADRWRLLDLVHRPGEIATEDNTDFDATLKARTQQGPRFHRVHQHMILRIQHRTRIHININALKELYNDLIYPWSVAYVNVRVVNMTTQQMENYIERDGVETFTSRKKWQHRRR